MTPLSPNSHIELGRLLRNARLDKRLEIAQAARALYIRPRYLEALEEGAPANLPGGTYARGYLLQYARYLGLPAEEVLAAFERLGAVQSRRLLALPDTLKREEMPARGMVWLTLGLAFAALVGLQYALRPAPLPPAPASALPAVSPALAPKLDHPCFNADAPVWPPCYYGALPEEIGWAKGWAHVP